MSLSPFAHNPNPPRDYSEIKKIRLLLVVFLSLLITAAEILGGLYSGSLSLISDAFHNLGDGMAIFISYLALKIAAKGNDYKRTFGYKRATILAALVNSAFLLLVSVFLLKEAFFRFLEPGSVEGELMMEVAFVGLVANIAGVALLRSSSHSDLNVRSSYLHLIGDSLSSVAVIIGGLVISYFGIYLIDPLLTVVIALYVFKESFQLIKKVVNILMQGVPEGIDLQAVVKDIESLEGVEDVHHVHLWSLNEDHVNFEAHVNVRDMLVSDTKALLRQIEELLQTRHGINHITIQFEHKCCSGEGIIKQA
jgi:cobalt-zinc-cadmium efflux system protein